MSYILEALKKSDQQRQRGVTPTLQLAHPTVAAPKRPLFINFGLLAALLVTGIVIGWLHPWQPEQPSPIPNAVHLTVRGELVEPPASQLEPFDKLRANGNFSKVNSIAPIPESIVRDTSSPIPQQAVPVAAPPAMQSSPVQASPAREKPARLAGDGLAQETMLFDELPVAIQQELPAMEVQLHAYSSVPGERLVSINSIRLREGGSLMPGLGLEQITPDGMIFSYKGYRFRRGVR